MVKPLTVLDSWANTQGKLNSEPEKGFLLWRHALVHAGPISELPLLYQLTNRRDQPLFGIRKSTSHNAGPDS